MQQIIILQGITVEQLMSRIDAAIEKKLPEILQEAQKVKPVRYMSRKEVAEFLQISLPTLHDWTKLGYVKSYKIGSRVLFKSDEINESIRARKFGR